LQAGAAANKAEIDGIARGEGRYQNGEYGRNRTEQLVNEAQETARRNSVIGVKSKGQNTRRAGLITT
jgi:hypothetical protein